MILATDCDREGQLIGQEDPKATLYVQHLGDNINYYRNELIVERMLAYGETAASDLRRRRLQAVLGHSVDAPSEFSQINASFFQSADKCRAPIKALVFTPDGKQVVSAGDDKVIRVWDWQAGKTVRTIRG